MPPRLKEAMIAQARAWGGDALERAIVALVDTDLTLRSQSRVPGMALVERVCAHVVVMALGRHLAQGRFDDIREDPAVQDAYLGARR